MKAIEEIYSDLFIKAQGPVGVSFLHVIPRVVIDEMNLKLGANVCSAEVEKVVFSLGAQKAPGPDGLNGEFF